MKEATGNRPSRLLNLNKSPKAQKLLASINAADSPFLRLPPETRCRIYDFTFGDHVIRVKRSQTIFCHSSQAYELEHRKHYDQRVTHESSSSPRQHSPSVPLDTSHTHGRSNVPVQLLQVCRQIYHEAVLKPFTQPSFDIDASRHDVDLFLARLVPGQARAIAHARFYCYFGFYLSDLAASQFKGLQHIELEIGVSKNYGLQGNGLPFELRDYFLRHSVISRLRDMGLKSVHLNVSIEGTAPDDALKDRILQWIKCAEDEALGVVSKQN